VRDANIVSYSSVNLAPANVSSVQNVTSIESNTTIPIIPVSDNSTMNSTLVNSTTVTQPIVTYHDMMNIPEVRTSFLGFIDTIFVWFRYIHFTIVPILIFLIHKVTISMIDMKQIRFFNEMYIKYIYKYIISILKKDVRKKTELLVCVCWRPNSIDAPHSVARPVSAYLYQVRKERKKKMKKYKNITNYR